MQVERVAKDLGSLSSEQRLAAVQRDAPELLQLIAELREGLTEVRSRVGPLLNEVGGRVLGYRWGQGWGYRWGCVRQQFNLPALLLLVRAAPHTPPGRLPHRAELPLPLPLPPPVAFLCVCAGP
jgi:hypothetical protein